MHPTDFTQSLLQVPKSAKLTFGDNPHKHYPNISIKNVYIFPGIPQFLEKLFTCLGSKLFQSEQKFFKKIVLFNVTEKQIVSILNQLVAEFPNVIFGSYPVVGNK